MTAEDIRAALGHAYRPLRSRSWQDVKDDRREFRRAQERVPDAMWAYLVNQGDIEEAECALESNPDFDGSPDNRPIVTLATRLDMLERHGIADHWLPETTTQSNHGERASQAVEEGNATAASLLTTSEQLRSEAFSAYAAAWASRDCRVLDFREFFLGGHGSRQIGQVSSLVQWVYPATDEGYCAGGHVLSEQAALDFLTSPVLGLCHTSELREHGVPFVGHKAWRYDSKRTYPGAVIEGQPPWSESIMYRGAYHAGERLRAEWITEQASTDICSFDRSIPGQVTSLLELAYVPRIRSYVYRNGSYVGPVSAACLEGSPLHELYKVAKEIASTYRCSPQCAPWWVLTGQHLTIPAPLQIEHQGYSDTTLGRNVLTLSIDTWLPPERVAAMYSRLRGSTVGARTRERCERVMRLARWVFSQTSAAGELPAAATLFDQWNSTYPEWRYAYVSWLLQDLKRAIATLRYAKVPPEADAVAPWPGR
jgi:hypothetical protein